MGCTRENETAPGPGALDAVGHVDPHRVSASYRHLEAVGHLLLGLEAGRPPAARHQPRGQPRPGLGSARGARGSFGPLEVEAVRGEPRLRGPKGGRSAPSRKARDPLPSGSDGGADGWCGALRLRSGASPRPRPPRHAGGGRSCDADVGPARRRAALHRELPSRAVAGGGAARPDRAHLPLDQQPPQQHTQLLVERLCGRPAGGTRKRSGGSGWGRSAGSMTWWGA